MSRSIKLQKLLHTSELKKAFKLRFNSQHILKESKTRRKNVAMIGIKNKKSDVIILQSWIIE